MEKRDSYTLMILEKLNELFEEEITREELAEGENFKHFMYALSVNTPSVVYNNPADEEKTILEVNHLANALLHERLVNKNT